MNAMKKLLTAAALFLLSMAAEPAHLPRAAASQTGIGAAKTVQLADRGGDDDDDDDDDEDDEEDFV